MQDCIFCRIVKGEIPCHMVYEDRYIIAFLDINPMTEGHTLVVSKEHIESFSDTSSYIATNIAESSVKIAGALKKALKPEGFNYFINEGKVAGQLVMHLHMHVVPRYGDDDVKFEAGSKVELDEEEMKAIAERISKEI
ncbi:MAG TPA: HIT family protein [Euryarchaeota archaeon]|nr:HIT-like protein [archaeon BMS3Bbin15]HDL15313.1 HIT family protein [Euryarchaeota archaeon]